MRILALDLGTKCGWAVGEVQPGPPSPATIISSGTVKLPPLVKGVDRRATDPRFWFFIRWLEREIARWNIEALVWEDVTFHQYRDQSQLWHGFRAIVLAVTGASPQIRTACRPAGELKALATGLWAASKEQMAQALKRKHPDLVREGQDDNEIDAIWLLLTLHLDMPRKRK